MRIAVCLKQVPDPATIEVDPFSGVIDARRVCCISSIRPMKPRWKRLCNGVRSTIPYWR
ncbi:MAG: hypothetical protein U1F76_09935 [Candidatus Competibacteraceae bacterium]